MKQGTILLIALTLSAVMITSSCGLLEGRADDSKAVESAVSDFLDSISDGSYAKDDYKSSFSKDKSFAKLKFEEEDAEKLMGIAFKKVSFKITDAEGDEKSEEGTCKVTLTAIDLKRFSRISKKAMITMPSRKPLMPRKRLRTTTRSFSNWNMTEKIGSSRIFRSYPISWVSPSRELPSKSRSLNRSRSRSRRTLRQWPKRRQNN